MLHFWAPASFYGRLFPSKSLHFVHSSSSLHWLSQATACLWKEEGKEAMNRGMIYISKKIPPWVLEAYAEQFREDFSVFLKSRSEETVKGGGMVLSFFGRQYLDPISDETSLRWEFLGLALMSMVDDGLIKEEKVDSFNAPYYAPCMEVEKEGSFTVEPEESFEIYWDGRSNKEILGDFATQSSRKRVAKTIRAVVESMFKSHFGGEIIDELFVRFEKIADDHLSKTRAKYINLVISLVRK